MTPSEQLFQDFCRGNQLACEAVPPAATLTPDFLVKAAGITLVVEVKQLDPNPADEAVATALRTDGFAGRTIYPGARVREELRKANKQLRPLAKEKHPGIVVLCDFTGPGGPYLDDYNVLTAMYGVQQVRFTPEGEGGLAPTGSFFGGDRTTTAEHNTTISAVARLEQGMDDSTNCTIFHNHWAAIPLDPALLRFTNTRQFRPTGNPAVTFTGWEEI